MDPVIAETNIGLQRAKDEDLLVLQNLGEEEDVEDEDLEDDDEDEVDDEADDVDDELDEEDDEDEDEDEDDDEDDVGTGEPGDEKLIAPGASANERPFEHESQAPDVNSDRVPSTDAEPEGSLDRVKSAPLGIKEIENLEDDAKGG